MKLSQSPEALEIKRCLREAMLGKGQFDAAEHNQQVRKLLSEEAWQQRMNQMPFERRQRAIDSVWEKVVAAKSELKALDARSCHRGLGDPDWMA